MQASATTILSVSPRFNFGPVDGFSWNLANVTPLEGTPVYIVLFPSASNNNTTWCHCWAVITLAFYSRGPVSNPGVETGYFEGDISWFSQSFQANVGIVGLPSVRPRPLPFIPLYDRGIGFVIVFIDFVDKYLVSRNECWDSCLNNLLVKVLRSVTARMVLQHRNLLLQWIGRIPDKSALNGK